MPHKGYHQTLEHRIKSSLAHIGIHAGEKNPSFGKHPSLETRAKLSASHIGKGMFGKKHSAEARIKMSKNHRDFSGRNHPMYGRHLRPETKAMISASLMRLDPKTRSPWQERARKIWEKANGPIPKTMLIHHIDENYKNNALENLAMITFAEHMKIHKSKRG
jgi:hypothetical protein